jgi:hypothetical protein
MKYRVRRNKLHGQFLTGGVNELRETLHDAFVRFDAHSDCLSKLWGSVDRMQSQLVDTYLD